MFHDKHVGLVLQSITLNDEEFDSHLARTLMM
jgi:hypothetical protein